MLQVIIQEIYFKNLVLRLRVRIKIQRLDRNKDLTNQPFYHVLPVNIAHWMLMLLPNHPFEYARIAAIDQRIQFVNIRIGPDLTASLGEGKEGLKCRESTVSGTAHHL